MISDERKKELRFEAWAIARRAILDAARSHLPGVGPEEDQYLSEFIKGIAERTAPGEYRELDDEEIAMREYNRGVVDGSEINVNILSESTALLEEQRLKIAQLQEDGREAIDMLSDISRALNDIGWPSSPMGVRTRACEAISTLGGLNKALKLVVSELEMQIKEMQER